MTSRKVYSFDFGRIELFSIDYKSMSGMTYFAYLTNEHCVGYSSNYSNTLKRLKAKALKQTKKKGKQNEI